MKFPPTTFSMRHVAVCLTLITLIGVYFYVDTILATVDELFDSLQQSIKFGSSSPTSSPTSPAWNLTQTIAKQTLVDAPAQPLNWTM